MWKKRMRGASGGWRQSMSDIWLCHITSRINNLPARKRRRLNRLSAPSIKIRLNQSFRCEHYFSFKYFHKPFALTMVTVVMSQQSQRTDPTEVDSQHNVWDSPEELLRNSIDPLGSRYLQPISEFFHGDSANTLHSKDMLSGLQIHAGGFWVLIWKALRAFLFLKDVFFLSYQFAHVAHGLSDHKISPKSNHELKISKHASQGAVTEKHHRALPPSALVRPCTREKMDYHRRCVRSSLQDGLTGRLGTVVMGYHSHDRCWVSWIVYWSGTAKSRSCPGCHWWWLALVSFQILSLLSYTHKSLPSGKLNQRNWFCHNSYFSFLISASHPQSSYPYHLPYPISGFVNTLFCPQLNGSLVRCIISNTTKDRGQQVWFPTKLLWFVHHDL